MQMFVPPYRFIFCLGLIDQDALTEALREEKIAGAALDVTNPEPLGADHPLLKLNNIGELTNFILQFWGMLKFICFDYIYSVTNIIWTDITDKKYIESNDLTI